MKKESNFTHKYYGPNRAIGYMQLMPRTAKGLGYDAKDPEQNIQAGVKYLAIQLKRFDGNERKALAAYNAGPNAVKRSKDIPSYTRYYVNKVLDFKSKIEI